MYKIVNKYNNEIYLGTEKAVIKYANEILDIRIGDTSYFIESIQDYLDIGFIRKGDVVEEIKNIELAIKFLQGMEEHEVVDIGDILEDLKNDVPVLITQEE